MVKAYLRYEPAGVFGVVSSGSSCCYDCSGQLLVTAALENVAVWNVKKGALVATLVPGPSGGASTSSSPHAAAAEVTCIMRAPGESAQIAAGYADGSIRMWDLASHECLVTLKGHKSAVTALRFSPSGALLASGSKDTDIIMWDVVGETGLYRLRGHKDQVTDLAFISPAFASSLGWLVSCSKDALVKAWDLDTQHCAQTLTGHKGEVWALDVDPTETRLITGSTDHELRVFAIDATGASTSANAAATAAGASPAALPVGAGGGKGGKGSKHGSTGTAAAGLPEVAGRGAAAAAGETSSSSRAPLLRPMGSVKRQAGGHDRVAALRFGPGGSLLACQSAGKGMELFRVRGEEEARKKLKRRKKRQREKALKKSGAGGGTGSDSEGEEEEGEDVSDMVRATDELEPHLVVPMKHKVLSFAFAPPAANIASAAGKRQRGAGALRGQIALSLANNCVEVVQVEGGNSEASPPAYSTLQRVELGGHRSDVRTCALSADGLLLATASNNALKIWNPLTSACLSTMDSGYGLCCLFAPGGRHVVLGTKEGSLEVFDLGAAERVHVDAGAHEGAVWSMAALPDTTGFVTGSADKTVKFWQWSVTVAKGGEGEAAGKRTLRLAHVRTLRMADDVLCTQVSADGRLLAVALLDATVKVFFADSLKFFLSLYGHKLPVLSMDISSDSQLLVTGSADKNIKVWGLDFGDCHRSLFAHSDAVMGVAFVPKTHYAFTVGKDKLLKYWDVDRSEQLLELAGHHGEVWCCAVSSYGDFVITGSHDRSLRRWQRSVEPFFVEEEKEARLESMFEADLEGAQGGGGMGEQALAGPLGRVAGGEGDEGGAAPAGRKTLDSISAADALVDALEMAAHEDERLREHGKGEPQQSGQASTSGKGREALPPNPMMMGLSANAYVLRALSSVRASDLESALIMLPFTDALRLLGYLPQWLEQGSSIELTTRVAVLLLRLHHSQLVATASARPLLLKLHKRLHPAIQGLKNVLGVNQAALQQISRKAAERSGVSTEARVISARKALSKEGG